MSASRRRWLIGGIAAASAAAGAGWALRREPSGSAIDPLWAMEFETPDGAKLPMAGLHGRPLLLNFWASWCVPCIKEMPQLDRFRREHAAQGWQVLGLAIDKAENVRAFLDKLPVGFPIALAGIEGMDLGLRLGNKAGALPYSVVFDARGKAVRTKLGETSFEELSRWAAELAVRPAAAAAWRANIGKTRPAENFKPPAAVKRSHLA